MEQPFSALMLRSNFGRQLLSETSLMVAHYYRTVVAVLIVLLLMLQLAAAGAATWALISALGSYAGYLILRVTVFKRYEQHFYTERMQFGRAQAGIVGVTFLLATLGHHQASQILWVLYLPALLIVSRYTRRQMIYGFVVCEVIALWYAATWWTQPRDESLLITFATTTAPLVALLLASFLTHYMAQVDIVYRRGASERDQIINALLRQVLVDTDGLRMWRTIQEACCRSVNATQSALYLFDDVRKHVQQLHQAGDRVFLGERHPLAHSPQVRQAVQKRAIDVRVHGAETTFFIPIFAQPDESGAILAILEITVQPYVDAERAVTKSFLADLLHHIWPLCAYADFRNELPALTTIVNGSIHHLQLNEVLDSVLETLCTRMGFTFATISLVDEHQQEISTIRGRNVQESWIHDAHHPLDSHDIQADVLRTGKTEVIAAWDPRFDGSIWTKYNHAELIRAWVPLGKLGTIEAGFYTHERQTIDPMLVALLEHYAHDVTTAIENAMVYEREQRLAEVLTSLQNLSTDLQMMPRNGDDRVLLQKIATAARDLLQADLIMLHLLHAEEQSFDQPVVVGKLLGDHILLLPHASDNIIHFIAHTREAYYQSDVLTDERLVGPLHTDPHAPRVPRTFTVHQQIRSFAGIPLLAHGRLLGVLSVNYRKRHAFHPSDRQILSLVGQVAASGIAGGQLQVEQERHRIQQELHDGVKSSLRGLIVLSHGASAWLDRDRKRARQYLHELRRATWGILSDINLVVHDIAPGGANQRTLDRSIRRELRQIAPELSEQIIVQIDATLPLLPHHIARVLFFIIREAVMNACEYAQATSIRIRLGATPDSLCLQIEDDGQGFDIATVDKSQHLGLISMEERARQVGGTFQITSGAAGTHILVMLPNEEEGNEQPRARGDTAWSPAG